MKKILIVFVLALTVLIFGKFSYAQMMGGFNSTATPDEVAQTTKDEAAGKAIWDKLQNKEVNCSNLSDDNFDVLGDFFMGNATGSNHASMDNLMTQRMGADGEKQMHIAMGKRLSGCETTATLPNGYGYFMPMMGGLGGMMGAWNQNIPPTQTQGRGFPMMGYGYNGVGQNGWGIFTIITWVLGIVFLILGSVYFWKGISKINK